MTVLLILFGREAVQNTRVAAICSIPAIGALGTWLPARRIGQRITRVDVLIGTFVGVAREAEKLVRTQRVAESRPAQAQAMARDRERQRPTPVWIVALVLLMATLAASYWYPRDAIRSGSL
jgi:hypothetical protein